MSLRLLDLLRLANVDLGHFKIHLATGRDDPPLTAYYDGRFKAWQERQNGKKLRVRLCRFTDLPTERQVVVRRNLENPRLSGAASRLARLV